MRVHVCVCVCAEGSINYAHVHIINCSTGILLKISAPCIGDMMMLTFLVECHLNFLVIILITMTISEQQ